MFVQPHFFISDEKKSLNPQQYGFRPNYSTSIALSDICNELLHNLEENKISCTVFLDLAKAFDTIDHTVLIKKLKQYGIRGIPLELLKNYPQNRKQQTLYLFQIRLLIVCCLLGRGWNRPFVLVWVLFACAVEQRRSSLQLLLIICTHLFICAARKRNFKKRGNCDLASVFDLLWTC